MDTPLPRDGSRTGGRSVTARSLLHWFGILSLVVAAGVAGYLGWLLWGTGLETQRAQNQLFQNFRHLIDTQKPPPPGHVALPGSAYAELVIPSINIDFMVVQGTDYADLKKGPGHYADTANPWDRTGRVGIAGHRTTYLHPFYSLDKVNVGDPITLRTQYGTFQYKVDRVFVVPAAGSGVVLQQSQSPTLVLTTCNPRFSATQRLIVTADRTSGP